MEGIFYVLESTGCLIKQCKKLVQLLIRIKIVSHSEIDNTNVGVDRFYMI